MSKNIINNSKIICSTALEVLLGNNGVNISTIFTLAARGLSGLATERITNLACPYEQFRGKAVNLQVTVFGELSVDTAIGNKRFCGEFSVNAQGEALIAEIRTLQTIKIASKEPPILRDYMLCIISPEIYDMQVQDITKAKHYLTNEVFHLISEIEEIPYFFSCSTNDLMQTTFGLSYDDAGTFLPKYVERNMGEYVKANIKVGL